MPSQKKDLNISAKTEYLKTVIDACANRRDSLETKSSILLATNAILLIAIIGLGIPIANNNVGHQYLTWLKLSLTIGALVFVLSSTLLASDILAPVFSDRQRRKVLDIPEAEHNLFWFGKIAELEKVDYLEKIDHITEEEILFQLVSEVHNVSRIIMSRYRILNRAYHCFVIGTVIFAVLAFTHLFPG